jgi:hypothetical protein
MGESITRQEPIPLTAKLWLAGVVLMLLALAASVGANALRWNDTMETVKIGSVHGVERLAGIDIPGSARLVNARLRHSMVDLDPLAWAILEMPRADARKMLTSKPLHAMDQERKPLRNEGGRFGDERIEDWRPDEAEEWFAALVGEERREPWHVTALADLDEEPARVYLLLER